jgi:hypothetical protein
MAKDITKNTPIAAFRESIDIRIKANGKVFGLGELHFLSVS